MADELVGNYLMPEGVKTGDGAAMATGVHEKKIMDDLEEALQELTEAMPKYEKAQAYYEGEVPEKFISAQVRKLLSGSDTDFRVNMAGRVVTAVLDRMEVASVTAEPLDEDDTDETPDDNPSDDSLDPDPNDEDQTEEPDPDDELSPEEKALDDAIAKIWRDNQMDIESPEIHEKMLEYGDAYLFVGLNEDEEGVVDLYYNSPLNVRILYDDENPRKKRLAIKRWCVGHKANERTRLNLYYEDCTYKFISAGKSKGTSAQEYEIYVDDSTDETGRLENETGEIPFFHFRTARPYGRPEHKNAYGPQDGITKLITNMMSNTDFTAFPQRWGMQDTGTSTDDDLDWGEADSETVDTTDPVDLQSQLISGPGRIWMLRNMKAVGQFATGDVEQFLKPINAFAGMMAATTGTPISYLQQAMGSPATPTSGESQRKGESPLISKINARQMSAESTWSDALGYGLRLKGLTGEAKVRWAPTQVVSGESGWKAVQEQQKAGVPIRQSLLEAGYTDAEVSSWGYTEDNPDGPGIDLSGAMSPPPVPGQPFPGAPGTAPVTTPGAPLPVEAPAPPPATTPTTPTTTGA